MAQTQVIAGDVTSGLTSLTAGNDGTLALVVGPAGGKLTALTIDAAGNVRNPVTQPGNPPVYGIRAWVNFNGVTTAVIRASGNVASVVRNGVGDYTINFTTAMPDANYSAILTTSTSTSITVIGNIYDANQTASAVRVIVIKRSDGTNADAEVVNLMIVR